MAGQWKLHGSFNLFFQLFLGSTQLVRLLSHFLDSLFRKSLFHLVIHLLSHNCKGVDTKRKNNRSLYHFWYSHRLSISGQLFDSGLETHCFQQPCQREQILLSHFTRPGFSKVELLQATHSLRFSNCLFLSVSHLFRIPSLFLD